MDKQFNNNEIYPISKSNRQLQNVTSIKTNTQCGDEITDCKYESNHHLHVYRNIKLNTTFAA